MRNLHNNSNVSDDEVEEGQKQVNAPMTNDYDGKDDYKNNNHDEICAEVSSCDGGNGKDEIPNFQTNLVSNPPNQVSQKSSLSKDVPEYKLHIILNDNIQHIYGKLPQTCAGRVSKVPRYLCNYSQ